MRDILTQVQAGKMSVDSALKSIENHEVRYALPTAVCEVHPDAGVVVTLHNWEGVSATKLDLIYHRMVVASQQFRATRLQQMRIEESKHVAP